MTISRFYRILLALCGLVGVSIQIHDDGWGMLLYYTVLSNILVFSSLIFFIIYDFNKGDATTNIKLLRYKGGVTMAILITGVIYHFLLAPSTKPEDFWTVRNLLVHYIVPWGLVLDTLVFDARKAYRLREPLYWSLAPLAYFAFALLNGLVLKLPIPHAKNSPFAYFFINVNKLGWNKVLLNVLLINAGYIAVGYLIYFLKRFIGCKAD